MRILLVLTLLFWNITAGCQNSNSTETPNRGEASSSQKSTSTSAPTTTQTPQSPVQERNRVATIQNSQADSQRSCEISAYVIDKDPKGLNVRSGPGEGYKIIGNLPTTRVAVIVDIAASQGDWVQLTKAQSPEKIEFQGTGWVKTQLLGTSTRGYGTNGVSVYASPSTQSSAIGRIPDAQGIQLLGCDRSWALVEYQQLKGWIEPDAQCANPLTTCP